MESSKGAGGREAKIKNINSLAGQMSYRTILARHVSYRTILALLDCIALPIVLALALLKA